MSRRKQSNPKPLKREDDDWVSDADGDPTPAPQSSPPPPSAPSSPEPPATPAAAATSATATPAPPGEEPLPRLRLKLGLATDPALRPPSDITAEFLAALPSALAASPYFCLPPPTTPAAKSDTAGQAPVYMCSPCGIRFSSLSTLEAHQTYYCSHRTKTTKGRGDSDSEEGRSMCSDNMADATPTGTDADAAAACIKAPRTGKQYGCPHCSYSADKKVSLNRHMRMHATSPGSGSDPVQPSSPHHVDRYCQDCDIRFSSAKTLRAHKQHYCSTRHRAKPARPSSPSSPPADEQPFLALPTTPMLLVPLSMLRGASLLPAPAAFAHNTACILLPDGSMQPTCKQAKPLSMRHCEVSQPLDLSMRRSPQSGSPEPGELVVDLDSDEDEKENRRISVISEEIICAPSLPLSVASSTPSPISPALSSSSLANAKRPRSSDSSRRPGSCSPKTSQTSPRNGVVFHNGAKLLERRFSVTESSSDIPPSPEDPVKPPPRLLPSSPPLPLPPQVLVKHGVSKCQECNIVFCRHDNYVAHKKHYCSARMEGGEEGRKGSSPGSPAEPPGTPQDPRASPPAAGVAIAPKPAVTLYQFICAACGIKFTSLDNLTAHQAYYCPKRVDNKEDCKSTGTGTTNSRRCVKCKAVSTGAEPHVCAGWKCLCCDVVSGTASAAQRHMDSHAGVKAFRCTICRYKGNTLRGMRTHIRMHFEKRAADLQEENFIICVVGDEEATSPVPAIPAQMSAPSPAVSPDSQGRAEKLHFCDLCNYSSTYKGNVVRHHKLVHSLVKDDEQGSGDQDEAGGHHEEDEPMSPEDVKVINIKKEPTGGSDSELDNNAAALVVENTSVILPDGGGKIRGPKYCKSCNISFTYLSTFIAHKKFYCESHARETRPGGTEASVLQN